MITMKVNPVTIPMRGENTSARIIFFRPAQWSAETPAWAMTAPAMPPMIAWDEEDGRP